MQEVIDEGDRSKQGTHRCPTCGRTINVKFPHYGDPPKCGSCDSYYKPKPRRNKFFS